MDRYGHDYYTKTEEYVERTSNTNLVKYGSKSYLSSDIGREKISKIIVEKYGSINPFSSKEIIDKIKNTNIIKYGVDNVSKSIVVKEKIGFKNRENWEKKFKEFYIKHNLEIINYENNIYEIRCNKCDGSFNINRLLLSNRLLLKTIICTNCNPLNNSNRSGYEIELFNFISSIYSGVIETNNRSVIDQELDVFIPDKNLAFEFNGLYWHSEKYKEDDYHYKKHKKCKDVNIELVQIWEDDWINKNSIVKSMISNKLGLNNKKIFARSCVAREISSKISNNFLSENHLQGTCRSKVNIGLFHNDLLVGVMTFGKLRTSLGNKDIPNNYELHRFCIKQNLSIVGGASKLLNFFKRNFKYDRIISYYDKSFGYKSFYEKIGFVFDGETRINYFYIQNGVRVHRYNFRKDILVKMGFDSNSTEREITKDMGLLRIYGPGNYRYLIEEE